MDLSIQESVWEEERTMKIDEISKIDPKKFTFVQKDSKLHDTKFDTKPIGYFKDAWYRFSRNKGSVIAAVIILCLLIFAIVVPIFSRFNVAYFDTRYSYAMPKSKFLSQFGILDGTKDFKGLNQQSYDYYNAIPGAITKVYRSYEVTDSGRTNTYYDIRMDSYAKVGFATLTLTKDEYEKLVAYEKETGIQVVYPIVDKNKISSPSYDTDVNVWYKHDTKGKAKLDDNGNYINIFQTATEDNISTGNFMTVNNDGTLNDQGEYTVKRYITKNDGNTYEVRALYSEYYKYIHGFEACFLFGVDSFGKDILVCLASGARLSFILAFSVSIINFILGLIYGSIEGYYGGKIDLVMERIVEILYDIPFLVMATLFQIYFARKVGVLPSLLFSFVLTGWIGIAGRTRTQFYRYKGQEYVFAARTLGARDRRIIFRHILPNALGTIITSAVLLIPGVINSESVLSFLGIVSLQTSTTTSVGTMLANGQSTLSTYPHVIFFPALFISLLMICFNMFGNGLRDAFNPSLRGSEG